MNAHGETSTLEDLGEEARPRLYSVSEISSNVEGEIDFMAVTDGSVRATVERHS